MSNRPILERTYARTLDEIVAAGRPGAPLQAWTFDDRASRRAAEDRLAARGVAARIRSAYKPLLHAFLEEFDLDGVTAVEIAYPVHPDAPAHRFRLEAYPLAALLAPAAVDFVARSDAGLHYDVTLLRHGRPEAARVFAPNRLHADATGERNLSPTGWLILGDDPVGARLATDYETLFEDAVAAVAAHPWGPAEPYFGELNLTVSYPAADEPLGFGQEVTSLREALHEDLYFSLVELFLAIAGRRPDDRDARPGQIVPEIVRSDGPVRLRIETRDLDVADPPAPARAAETATAPLSSADVARALDAVGGTPLEAPSRAGRRVAARYRAGGDRPVTISAGQHANEPTGVVGALRAAAALARRPDAHFVVSPLENPDGYAVARRLAADNPAHMQHAARYTAFGDDLDHRVRRPGGGSLFEKEIHLRAAALAPAGLHVNLHGYPSHEWTRPLSGYVPRRFARWTLPKGFFLILRHRPGWAGEAEALADRVTRRLGLVPGLLAFNAAQIALYERHAGETGFRMINGFPCLVSVQDRPAAPVVLITEYPDETLSGEAFRAGHTAQMEACLAAYDAWQEIGRDDDGETGAT